MPGHNTMSVFKRYNVVTEERIAGYEMGSEKTDDDTYVETKAERE